jgi:hypothetical protein
MIEQIKREVLKTETCITELEWTVTDLSSTYICPHLYISLDGLCAAPQ